MGSLNRKLFYSRKLKWTVLPNLDISTFESCTALLTCPFCLEKSFSFCMTGFLLANITILPKERAQNSPLNFSCEHKHLSPMHSTQPVEVPVTPRTLPFCMERGGTWEAPAQSCAAVCGWSFTPYWDSRAAQGCEKEASSTPSAAVHANLPPPLHS